MSTPPSGIETMSCGASDASIETEVVAGVSPPPLEVEAVTSGGETVVSEISKEGFIAVGSKEGNGDSNVVGNAAAVFIFHSAY